MTRIDAFENLPRSIRNRKRARYICVLLHLLAILILGLMCGSELNVGAFAHPTLNAQTLDVHVPVRAALARLLGRVMPFWMITSTLLNLALLLPFEGLAGHLLFRYWQCCSRSRCQFPSTTESCDGPQTRSRKTGERRNVVGIFFICLGR
jgi:hypothetical protein